MTKSIFTLVFLLMAAGIAAAQNTLEWSENYRLQASDFEAAAPNDGQLLAVNGSFSLEYEMSGIKLLASRNLNNTVSVLFQKDASYIDTGEESTIERLLDYEQLIFDMYELQARKLRKKFFEEKMRLRTKGPSEMHKEVQAEHQQLLVQMQEDTFYGASPEELGNWMQKIQTELEKLAAFCKDCTPPRKK